MDASTIIATIRQKFELLQPVMTERMRRQWGASEALALPRGGMTRVAQATGLSRTTLWAGVRELRNPSALPPAPSDPRRCRRPAAGGIWSKWMIPACSRSWNAWSTRPRGDPMSPLRWTCKSTRKLAEELQRQGHDVSHQTVALLLQAAGYSLQSNRKTRDGNSHPDRNAQFEFINARVQRSRSGAAGGLSGYQEEGIDRGFQERRARMAAGRGNPRRYVPRTSRTSDWARRSPTGSTIRR